MAYPRVPSSIGKTVARIYNWILEKRKTMEPSEQIKINKSVAWIILSRTMCLIDKQPLDIEETVASNYAINNSRLNLREDRFTNAKNDVEQFNFEDAVEFIKNKETSVREEYFFGLILVASSDKEIKEEELDLLAFLSETWSIDESKTQKFCFSAQPIRYLT